MQPVSLQRLLDVYRLEYWVLPEKVQGMLVQMGWNDSTDSVEIAINEKLSEEPQTASRRTTIFHEIGHEICKHESSTFMLYDLENDRDVSKFDKWLDAQREKEAFEVGAYLGVPADTIQAADSIEMSYIARMLELNEEMVQIRWQMMQKWEGKSK